jgi:hypothetical protein
LERTGEGASRAGAFIVIAVRGHVDDGLSGVGGIRRICAQDELIPIGVSVLIAVQMPVRSVRGIEAKPTLPDVGQCVTVAVDACK